jgi:hypothetical protein
LYLKNKVVSEFVLKPKKNEKYSAANISGEWYLGEAAAFGLKSC